MNGRKDDKRGFGEELERVEKAGIEIGRRREGCA